MKKQKLSKNQLKKEFIKFLKERALVTKYCAYLAGDKPGSKRMSLSGFLNKYDSPKWISYAFLWRTSVEGARPWIRYSIEWKVQLFQLGQYEQ